MKPTGPIPPHFSANDAGELLIGGLPPEELIAEAGGTPLFVYDNNIVGGQIAPLRGDAGWSCDILLCNRKSLRAIAQLHGKICRRFPDRLRVASWSICKRAGLAGIGMTFAGPGKLDDELEAGIEAGATISVESESEAARAIHAGERVGIQPKLAVRVNPPFPIENGRVSMGAVPARSGSMRSASRSRRGPDRGGGRLARPAYFRCRPVPRRRGADPGTPGDHRHAGEIADARDSAARAEPRRWVRHACFSRREADRHRSRWRQRSTKPCEAPRCSRRRDCRSSSAAGWSARRRLSDPRARPHRKLRRDLPHHRWRRPSPARRDRLPRRARRGNYPIAVANRFGAPAEEKVTVTGCLATPSMCSATRSCCPAQSQAT